MGVRLIVGLFVVNPVLGHPLHRPALQRQDAAKGQEVLHPLISLETPVGQRAVKTERHAEHPGHVIQNDSENQARAAVVGRIQGEQRGEVNGSNRKNGPPHDLPLILAVDGKTAIFRIAQQSDPPYCKCANYCKCTK